MTLLAWIFGAAAFCAILAYVPLVLAFQHRERTILARRRPVNEVLADMYAQGQITQERYEQALDEVHRALPTPDAAYPLVREVTRR